MTSVQEEQNICTCWQMLSIQDSFHHQNILWLASKEIFQEGGVIVLFMDIRQYHHVDLPYFYL